MTAAALSAAAHEAARRRSRLGPGLIMAAVGDTALGILGEDAVISPVVVLRAHHRETAREAMA